MTTLIGKAGHFDDDNDEWEHYVERLAFYFTANKILRTRPSSEQCCWAYVGQNIEVDQESIGAQKAKRSRVSSDNRQGERPSQLKTIEYFAAVLILQQEQARQ